jgi:hypothetical protein
MFTKHDLQLGAGAFFSFLAGSSLVQSLVSGGHLNVTRDAVASTLAGALVAVVHKFLPEGK